jgi:hypothetical protein
LHGALAVRESLRSPGKAYRRQNWQCSSVSSRNLSKTSVFFVDLAIAPVAARKTQFFLFFFFVFSKSGQTFFLNKKMKQ